MNTQSVNIDKKDRVINNDLIYFLHIPKTAGMSTWGYFKDNYEPAAVCPHWLWDQLAVASEAELASWRVYLGHFGGLLPLWLRTMPRIVTVLRNPISRVISHIRHVQRDTRHPLHGLAADLSVGAYCSHPVLRRSVENLQSRYLASLSWAHIFFCTQGDMPEGGSMSVGFEDALHALDRSADLLLSALAALDRLDAVGIAEEHSATLELFAKVLSLPDPGREYCTNVGDAEGKPSLGPADLAAVEAITEIDRAVYQRGRELFKARARSII